MLTADNEKKKLLVSFSGGRTSAYMTWWLWNNVRDVYDMIIVFANTGKEREETLLFVNDCSLKYGFPVVWVEALVFDGERKGTGHKVVSFESAARDGEPFEAIIKKYGIPNQSFPHCTRELKTNPIHSYMKAIGWKNYVTAIGIRSDEMDRINYDHSKKNNYWYPLAENGITKRHIILHWQKEQFDLCLKDYEGNCDWCWKKNLMKLQTIAKEHPAIPNWWREMEQKYGHFMPSTRPSEKYKPPFVFGRKNMSVQEILSSHSSSENIQLDLFEYGCKESCEAF